MVAALLAAAVVVAASSSSSEEEEEESSSSEEEEEVEESDEEDDESEDDEAKVASPSPLLLAVSRIWSATAAVGVGVGMGHGRDVARRPDTPAEGGKGRKDDGVDGGVALAGVYVMVTNLPSFAVNVSTTFSSPCCCCCFCGVGGCSGGETMPDEQLAAAE